MIYTGNKSWTGELNINVRASGQKTISFTLEKMSRLEGLQIEHMLSDLGEALGSERGLGKVTSIMVSVDTYSMIVGHHRFKTMRLDVIGNQFLINGHSLPTKNVLIVFAYETPVIEIEEL